MTEPATAAGMEPAPDTSWVEMVEIKDYGKQPATAAGQFHEDHERDMADPEYAEAFREATTAAQIAELTDTLTRPRFHTHCGETHTPGPCNDGITRPAPDSEVTVVTSAPARSVRRD